MEFLKNFLDEELFNKVYEKLKDNSEIKLVNLSEGKYVAKEKFDNLLNQFSALKEKFEALNASNQMLLAMYEELKSKETKEKEELNKELESLQFESKLELYLLKEKARNIKAVSALIDKEKLTLVNGEIKGLKEQVDGLKENEPYLFLEEEVIPSGTGRLDTYSLINKEGFLRDLMGLTK